MGCIVRKSCSYHCFTLRYYKTNRRVDIFMKRNESNNNNEMSICIIEVGLLIGGFWKKVNQVLMYLEKIKSEKFESKKIKHLSLGEEPFSVVVMTLKNPHSNENKRRMCEAGILFMLHKAIR